MKPSVRVNFPPFQLDATNEQLWRMTPRGTEALRLRPKTFAVLCYLLERHQQLVTKDQLLSALWPDTWVTDSALKSCVRELREALKDKPQAPQFIETVHRRGYRFIGKVVSDQSSVVSPPPTPLLRSQLATGNWELTTPLVGRESELAQLHHWLEKALNGERQIVFVIGEPGIGKTSMVDTFLQSLASSVQHQEEARGWRLETSPSFPQVSSFKSPASSVQTLDPRRQMLDDGLWIGRGQCIEHYGVGEPYMPIFEALGRLCREPAGTHLIDILSQHAPAWIVQMPSLLQAAELEKLQRKVRGTTQERMLREMAEALEVISDERPLILVLEDLHWSDSATLELLAMLARRRERARLLVLATYRPADVVAERYPLRSVLDELQLHGYGNTLPVDFLTRSHVATYLSQRFPDNAFSPTLAEVIHQRTDGNPLFMVSIVDELIRQTRIARMKGQWTLLPSSEKEDVAVPESLKRIIARQIEDLDYAERRILEAASVVDAEFSSAVVAAVLVEEVEAVETSCDTLARRGRFLQSTGPTEGPDGTIAARYRFVHALYREVLYNRLAVNKRVRLHGRIGAWQEAAYGERAREIAGELALHFERGREYRRAVRYHQRAGENALQRSAHKEALAHFDAGLCLLNKLPVSSGRIERELSLQIARAAPLGMIHGYGSPTVEEAYERAHALCQQLHESPQLFPVLGGLTSVLHMRGKLRQAHALEGRLLRIAQQAADKTFLLWAYLLQGVTAYNRGQLSIARRRIEAALRFYDPRRHNPQASGGREDPGILSCTTLVSTLWLLGYPDQALRKLREVQSLAEQSADPLSRVMALGQAAVLHQRRREGQAALESADAFLALAREQGFSFRVATGMIYRGWALAECGDVNEGVIQICAGLEAIKKTGALLARPYYLVLLGEAYRKAEQIEEALRVLKEALALAHTNDDRFYEAEAWRLMGVVCRQKAESSKHRAKIEADAEQYFQQALMVARRQKAKSLELRAAVNLGRAWAAQGHGKKAYRLLSQGYSWFTEGLDTADLQEARVVLEGLKK